MAEIDPLSLDFARGHPDSFARILGRGDATDCERILESLPTDLKAVIVARLPTFRIAQLLRSEQCQPANWLVDAPLEDAVTLLSRIPREQRLDLINSMQNRDRQRQLLRIQQYPAHSIGTLLDEVPLRVTAASPAAEVLDELRELDLDDRSPVVVVDADGRYLGVLNRWRLLLRNPSSGVVKDYIVGVRAVQPETPITQVAMNDAWRSRNWLPVVDHRKRVLGAVSREKVLLAAGVHSRDKARSAGIVLDLLADVVHLCEAILLKTISRKDTT